MGRKMVKKMPEPNVKEKCCQIFWTLVVLCIVAANIAAIVEFVMQDKSPPDPAQFEAALEELKEIAPHIDLLVCPPDGHSAESLAEGLGMDYATFVVKCTGAERFTSEEMARLAEILGVDPEKLAPDDEPPDQDPDTQNGVIAW